jgi:methylated-DNA-[protein]-cysteine S-methyltransferase
MQAQERTGFPQEESADWPLRVLMPSPIGALGVELTGSAVSRLRIEPVEAERSIYTPLHRIDGSDFLDEVFGRLSEYFAGARRKLELDFDLGPCGVNGLARRVLRETAKIPYGKTRSCHALADAIGSPDSSRQVLSILLENPIPILIPCHRVLADRATVLGASIGSYIGGAERKRWLLEFERREEEPV